MKNIIFFDTNFLYDNKIRSFFGRENDLKNFLNYAQIVIPDMVIGELEEKYRRKLECTKGDFLKNWRAGLFNYQEDEINIEKTIQELKSKIDIEYKIISITNYSILEQIKNLALRKEPPFEKEEGTDKGFKDTYIYYTILEYIGTLDPKKYSFFVCTYDGRFKEALKRHDNITVISSFEDFRLSTILVDDYLLSRLSEEVKNNVNFKKEDIFSIFENIDSGNVLIIGDSINEMIYRIIIEKGEIISRIHEDFVYEYDDIIYDLDGLIKSRGSSGSFAETHRLVKKINEHLSFFNKEELIQILSLFTQNNQLYRLMSDDDVASLIHKIYDFLKDDLDDELKETIKSFIE